MAEIFEVDDIPTAAATGNNADSGKDKAVVNDKHIPSFDFDSYPKFDDDLDSSPRIVDEVWQKYEK